MTATTRSAPSPVGIVDGIGWWHVTDTASLVLPAQPMAWLVFAVRGGCTVGEDATYMTLAAPQQLLLSVGAAALPVQVAPAGEVLLVGWPAVAFAALGADLPEPLASFAAALHAGAPAKCGPVPLLPMGAAAAAELLRPPVPGPLGQLRQRARLWEVLALHTAALVPSAPTRPPGLSEYDEERLRFARDYLIQHAQLPPSLPELARVAGLNECKLKRGFKALYGLPTFAYLAEWRLLEARQRLLTEPRPTASEVAFELGYASLQHFSAAFRQRFGRSPRDVGRS